MLIQQYPLSWPLCLVFILAFTTILHVRIINAKGDVILRTETAHGMKHETHGKCVPRRANRFPATLSL